MADFNLESLNVNQRKAVEWGDGPLLVLAGPGSGKTLVLTMRVARLIRESEENSVLALTFTSKAASEMRERVDQLLGERGDRAHLSTFHSFAADLLRQHGSHVGVQPSFTLVTQDDDRLSLLEDAIRGDDDLSRDVPSDRRNLLSLVDRLFAESYESGASLSGPIKSPPWIPKLFDHYRATLLSSGRLDYGSLLYLARQLLLVHRGVARTIKASWTHVCVDEFQDTNKSQYDLLRLVVPDASPNLFVVADDDQIIYQWNGASPERLQALRVDYQMQVVQLPENYRCPREVIDLANLLIEFNSLRTPGKQRLTTARPVADQGNVVRLGEYSNPEEEFAAVANDIVTRKIRPEETVVLGRTTRLLEMAARALERAGLVPHVGQRKTDFEVPLVRVMVHALRLANSRHDSDLLRRLCVAWDAETGQSIEVGDVDAASALVGGDYLRAWAQSAAEAAQPPHRLIVDQINAGLVDRLRFPEIVDWFLDEGAQAVGDSEDFALSSELATWRELHGDIVRERSADELTLNAYLQDLDLASKAPRPAPNAIRCMTVHAAKGLEFSHVYLVGMAQEVFPSFHAVRKGLESREVEEERRNCFVAITRARQSLTLTRARSYYGYAKSPSMFLREMGISSGNE
jgi:ATP-dependent DNA helicase UvrD/PcrA